MSHIFSIFTDCTATQSDKPPVLAASFHGKSIIMKYILTSLLLGMLAAGAFAQPHNLKTDNLVSPLGIDNAAPRLSWENSCKSQKSYSLTVGTDSLGVASGKGDAWTTGNVDSPAQGTVYSGKPLKPFSTYFWRVTSVDNEGKSSSSEVAKFEMGMIDIANWQGSWISDGNNRDFKPAPYMRKTFTVSRKPVKARAYISAGGLFVLSVNGKRVGDHFLDPVYTRYDRRCKYVTFDITPLLQNGINTVGVVLGNGWYNHQAYAVWDYERAPWRQRPAMCMDIRITYDDGSVETVPSDLTWRTSADVPLVYNNIYTGEHFDFRINPKGWDTAQFDDSKWSGVRLRQAPAPIVSAQAMQPIRFVEDISAKTFRKLNDSTYIYDFGKNMAGVTTVKLHGDSGTVVRVAHGERLHKDGTLDLSNIDVYYRGDRNTEPFQTDILTLSGGEDTFTAAFSYKGFRYVQVSASRPTSLEATDIVAHFTHSDVAKTGSIKSSNPLLDKIVAATCQAYISNFMGLPTDCPQREKNGWTGDGHLAIETGLYNYDGFNVYEKWLADHRDEQQPNGVLPDIIPTDGWGYGTDNGLDWTSTIAIIPWNLYLFYGDERPLRDCYDNIKRYVDYVDRNSPSHLSSWGRGDWVPVKTRSDKELSSSIYFYVDADILAKAAKLFGKNEDHEYYSRLARQIRDAINAKFLNRETGVYASGSQTEQSMPLMWGIVPEEMRTQAAMVLAEKVKAADNHIDCGVLGAKAMLNALSENGYADLAYDVAVQDTYPSWGWWIVNGATTLLENWDLKATRDISDNHIMFGEIGAWPYKALGGIFPDENAPGFKHTILRPNFIEKLGSFEARHTTPYGEIVSKWEWNKKRTALTYTVTIPANTSATLLTPWSDNINGGTELDAGTHVFKYKVPREH